MDKPLSMAKNFIQADPWVPLRKFTNARIAVGRAGTSIPLLHHLKFIADHAQARDAVYAALDHDRLATKLNDLGLPVIQLQSNAGNRVEYLQRPDKGRQLNDASQKRLGNTTACDIAFIITDGLSARAVQQHAVPVLSELSGLCINNNFSMPPVCIVQQGRVAVSDETGMLLKAKLAVILIGERPGLSSPHSMGIYITYNPVVGLTDESRNCISNIHPNGGITYTNAAQQAFALIQNALTRQLSGVNLKVQPILNSSSF